MISRRRMLAQSGGILLAGGVLSTNDAFAQTQPKDLIFRTDDPRNAEPELGKLVQSWVTPTKHFYVRSHAPNPDLSPDSYRLQVEGMVRKPVSLSLDELGKFGAKSTTATLTCAGNRRSEYNKEGKVGGVQWEAGAIGNAKWGGVSLAELLKQVEITPDAKHVWFEGLDKIPKNGKVIGFGGSIPIQKAMIANGPGAPLLASSMNGETLTPDHGYPLRSLVPGYIGARSVKWLGKIVVSDRPSPNHYVATAYKIVKKTEPLDWIESAPIYRFPVNAAICAPKRNTKVSSGEIELTGYALPTGRPGSKIKKVEVSSNGSDWVEAKLTGEDIEFCWQLWNAKIGVNADTKRLLVRAFDTSGGFMPARVPWNAKGYLQNSWYRLPIKVG